MIDSIPIMEIEKNSKEIINLDYLIFSKEYYKINIKKALHLKCTADQHNITLIPQQNWTGLTTLSLEIQTAKKQNNIDIPIIVKQMVYPVKIKYTTKDPQLKTSVAGSFNGWNAQKNRLEYNKNISAYTCTLLLKPGLYQYKFVVNDNWIYDKDNPDKSSDGFGGFNSILKAGATDKEELTILPFKKNKYFLFSKKKIKYNKSHIHVVLNNQLYNSITIKENIISLKHKRFNDLIIIVNHPQCQIAQYHFHKKQEKWNKSIIYFTFTDRFFNGDKKNDRKKRPDYVDPMCDYMGGDFKGITKKINQGYFKTLGIDTLWLSPVNDNPEKYYKDHYPPHKYFGAYHSYWPSHPTKVENHFGTEKDLHTLINTAHKNNIKVIFDMVFNHTHTNHPYYQDHAKWYGSLYTPDKQLNLRLFDAYPYTTWFDFWIPSIDYNNKEVQKKMIENAIWWIKKYNIDGFRLDAVKHIPPEFWKKLRLAVKREIEFPQKKLFYMVGESIADQETINKFIGYDQLDGQFDFPLYFSFKDTFALETSDLKALNNTIWYNQILYKGLMSSFIGNHDFARFITYADGDLPPGSDERKIGFQYNVKTDKPDSYNRMKRAFFCLFTLSEIPLIYYGDEIGLSGATDPDNRRMMKFKINSKQNALKKFIQKIIKIRKKHPSLYKGKYIPLVVEKDLLIYLKIYYDQIAIIGLSLSQKNNYKFKYPQWLNIKKIKNVWDKAKIDHSKKSRTIKLKKFNYFLYIADI